ncbi:MAG: alginate export family protein [Puniceicoccaceae bacterium]
MKKNHFLLLTILWLALGTSLVASISQSTTSATRQAAETPAEVKLPNWKPGDPITLANGLLEVDAQIRHRFEWRENWIDFNSAVNFRDDSAILQRLRLGLKAYPADSLTVYVQGQDSRTFFDNASSPSQREFVLNDSPFDLRQAWVQFDEVLDQDLTLKLGRQVLSYGQQRLVGGFEWDNNARTFDAARAIKRDGDLTLDLFAGFVVLHKTQSFNSSDSEDLFTGLYVNYKGWDKFQIDGYVLGRFKSDVEASTVFRSGNQTNGNPSPRGDYATIGTLWQSQKEAFGPFDFNAEVALQLGRISNPTGFGPLVAENPINTSRQDLVALALHLESGYTFNTVHGKPRIHAEYNFSTGDEDPNDGRSTTFQNLFPTNHLFYGDLDRFSWQNLHNISAGVRWKPAEKVFIKSAYHFFWLADTNDVWRFAGQGAVGGAARYGNALNRNPSSYVGSEFNLSAQYRASKWFRLEAGYSHFNAGSYIGDTAPVVGTRDDAEFAYVQSLFNF